jgi:acyl transferase domain-containing protein
MDTLSATVSPTATALMPQRQSQKLAYLFSGQGSVHADMAQQLFSTEPVFRGCLERCSDYLDLSPSLIQAMFPSHFADTSKSEARDLNLGSSALYSQLSLVAVQLSLYSLLRSRGVDTPQAVYGHSLGEYAAAVCCGALTETAMLSLVKTRAQLIDAHTEELKGVMVAARLSEQDVLLAIGRLGLGSTSGTATTNGCSGSNSGNMTVAVASVMGAKSVVLTGHKAAVETVLGQFGQVSHKYLPLDVAYHSSLMGCIAAAFRREADAILSSENASPQCIARCDTQSDTQTDPQSNSFTGTSFVSCVDGKVIGHRQLCQANIPLVYCGDS